MKKNLREKIPEIRITVKQNAYKIAMIVIGIVSAIGAWLLHGFLHPNATVSAKEEKLKDKVEEDAQKIDDAQAKTENIISEMVSIGAESKKDDEKYGSTEQRLDSLESSGVIKRRSNK